MEFADDDIVIIDSYHAPLEFYQKIAKTTAHWPFYIDDNNRIDYPDRNSCKRNNPCNNQKKRCAVRFKIYST